MAQNFQETAARLVEEFSGQKTTWEHHDAVKKVFVLVVSGDQAEHFRKVVDSVRALADAERRRSKQEQA